MMLRLLILCSQLGDLLRKRSWSRQALAKTSGLVFGVMGECEPLAGLHKHQKAEGGPQQAPAAPLCVRAAGVGHPLWQGELADSPSTQISSPPATIVSSCNSWTSIGSPKPQA